jgi:hypothetical protein
MLNYHESLKKMRNGNWHLLADRESKTARLYASDEAAGNIRGSEGEMDRETLDRHLGDVLIEKTRRSPAVSPGCDRYDLTQMGRVATVPITF